MNRKVLVTGGAGYIGSVLVGELLGSGHSVTVLDRLMYKQRSLLGYCDSPAFNFINGDVRDERIVKDLVAKADIIIPLAALVGAKLCDDDPITAEAVNY